VEDNRSVLGTVYISNMADDADITQSQALLNAGSKQRAHR